MMLPEWFTSGQYGGAIELSIALGLFAFSQIFKDCDWFGEDVQKKVKAKRKGNRKR